MKKAICIILVFLVGSASMAATDNLAENSKDDLTELRFRTSILETYKRLREGKKPDTNLAHAREALDLYRGAYDQARSANNLMMIGASENCKRFGQLYNEVGSQFGFYSQVMLDPAILPQQSSDDLVLVESRLKILSFYESALFVLVLLNSEAGRSTLDPTRPFTCAGTGINRARWANTLLRNHQAMDNMVEIFFGRRGADSEDITRQKLEAYAKRYERKNDIKAFLFLSAEIIGSVFVWNRLVHPLVFGQSGLMKAFVGSAFVAGTVAFDRTMRDYLPFLGPPRKVEDFSLSSDYSTWDRIMKGGQELAVSVLVSPALYVGYLNLFGTMEKQRVSSFVAQNNDIIEQAEQEYGSVDNAIRSLRDKIKNFEKQQPN